MQAGKTETGANHRAAVDSVVSLVAATVAQATNSRPVILVATAEAIPDHLVTVVQAPPPAVLAEEHNTAEALAAVAVRAAVVADAAVAAADIPVADIQAVDAGNNN